MYTRCHCKLFISSRHVVTDVIDRTRWLGLTLKHDNMRTPNDPPKKKKNKKRIEDNEIKTNT